MLFFRKIGIVLAFLCCTTTLLAQNLEWAHGIRGDTTFIPNPQLPSPFLSIPRQVTVDTENNSYLLGEFDNLKFNTNQNTSNTLVKYNEKGEQCWHKNFEKINIEAIGIEDGTCDIFSLITVGGNTKIGDSTYSFPNRLHLVLLKTDSAFNVKWARILSDSLGYLSHTDDKELFVTKDNIYFQIRPSRYFKFKNVVYKSKKVLIPTHSNVFIWIKLSKNQSGSTTEWVTPGYSLVGYDEPIGVDAKGNFYSLLTHHSTNIYIHDSILINSTSAIVRFSSATGALEKVIPINSFHCQSATVTPSSKIFLSLTFDSTFNYQSTTFSSKWNQNALCLFLDSAGNLLWSAQEDNSIGEGYAPIINSAYRNNNIYCSGYLTRGNSGFGGFPLKLSDTVNPKTIFYTAPAFAKFDTLGNCLWAFTDSLSRINQASSGRDLAVDYNGNPIVNAAFSKKIHLLDTFIDFNNNTTNALIFKLTDFAIFRGYVKAGPYCAGDTIEIPYSPIGKFQPDNEFIAQLSDENGEFFGGERELGRVKSNTKGIVKGLLPLFNVKTSGNYRIRILATKPAVQSYYRQDTLRLLIYSRDSANAGNDTLICKGQSVQLSTTGGSRWQWSPAKSLNDSALFKPIATPTVDTRYRIIISDSSGCGDTDTDYVWVRVRKPLDIEAPFTDSSICRGQFVTLYASGGGGDSTNHTFTWYEKRPTGDVEIGKATNSIQTTSTQDPKTIYTVLTDNCTVKPDTQFYTLQTLPPLSVSICSSRYSTQELKDSLLCYNAPIKLFAKAQGGKAVAHQLQWYGDNAINQGDSLALSPAPPNTYYVVLTDNCTARPDTAFVSISQRQPLSLTIAANDSLCQYDIAQLQATFNGGDSSQYQFTWKDIITGWSDNQPNTQHIPNTTTTYIATLNDNCSPEVKDSIRVTVHQLPTPGFSVSDTFGCPPLNMKLTDVSTNHNPDLTIWYIDGDRPLSSSNTSKLFNKTSFTSIKQIVTNPFGCKDSISKTKKITIFKKPVASFTVTPKRLETEDPVNFSSTSRYAFKYQWDLGNGFLKYSNGDTSAIYSDSGFKTITLVVENSLGCKDTAYKTIRIYNKVYCSIPSGFTPNGDGLNNTFAPECVGISNYTLTIYNRWGQIIYQAKNGAWDGSYSDKPAPEGVYMYKIHLHAENKNKSMVYGSVNLIR